MLLTASVTTASAVAVAPVPGMPGTAAGEVGPASASSRWAPASEPPIIRAQSAGNPPRGASADFPAVSVLWSSASGTASPGTVSSASAVRREVVSLASGAAAPAVWSMARSAACSVRAFVRSALSRARSAASRDRSSTRWSFSAACLVARSSRMPRRSIPRFDARFSARAPSRAEAKGAALCDGPASAARGAAGRTPGTAAVTGAFIGRPPPWSGHCARSSGSRDRAGCRRSGSPCRGRRCRPPARGRWTRTASSAG